MLSYRFCDRTVTIYRLENGTVQRLVAENCYYFWQTKQVRDATGTRQNTKFLLIMPGATQRVFPGDRIFDGVGPAITAEDWPRFVPALIPGLGQVAYTRCCWWDGEVSHVEAGNK